MPKKAISALQMGVFETKVAYLQYSISVWLEDALRHDLWWEFFFNNRIIWPENHNSVVGGTGYLIGNYLQIFGKLVWNTFDF